MGGKGFIYYYQCFFVFPCSDARMHSRHPEAVHARWTGSQSQVRISFFLTPFGKAFHWLIGVFKKWNSPFCKAMEVDLRQQKHKAKKPTTYIFQQLLLYKV